MTKNKIMLKIKKPYAQIGLERIEVTPSVLTVKAGVVGAAVVEKIIHITNADNAPINNIKNKGVLSARGVAFLSDNTLSNTFSVKRIEGTSRSSFKSCSSMNAYF